MSIPCLEPAESTADRRSRRLPAANNACLRDMLACLDADADLSDVDPDIPVAVWQVFKGGTLLLEGQSVSTLYVVRSGTFKTARMLEDGYEQVLSFSLPGELLGSVALHQGQQVSTVIALEDCTVYALPVAHLRSLRPQCQTLDTTLQQALSRQLVRAAETSAMSAPVSSDVRLARFLLWMSHRMAETGQSPNRLLLRMCRRDIASLLCVAHETVSRAFTNLAHAGHLSTRRKEVELIDMAGLREFSLFTRGPAPEVRAPRGTGGEPPVPMRIGPLPASSLGRPAEVCPDLRQALESDPWHAVAHHDVLLPA